MTHQPSPHSVLMILGIFVGLTITPATAYAQKHTLGPIPTTFNDFNPCTGEPVVITGELRIFIYQRPDAAGGDHLTVRTLSHGKGESVDRVDPTRMKTYLFNSENVSETNSPASGTAETTQVVNHVLVRQGNDQDAVILLGTHDDFLSKLTVHFTFGQQGSPTAEVFKGHTSCPE